MVSQPENAPEDLSLLASGFDGKEKARERDSILTPGEARNQNKLIDAAADKAPDTISGKKVRKAIATALLVGALTGSCTPGFDESTPTSTEEAPGPAETQLAQASTQEVPQAGAEDEISIEIQAYLNEYCPELGIFGARVLVERLSDNQGNAYAFVEAQFRADDEVEARRLPLMIKIGENDEFGEVIIIEENLNFGAEEYLVEREYLGFQYDPSQQNLVDLGPILHLMRVGEFQTPVDYQWVVIRAFVDQHLDPMETILTADSLARPSETINVVQPEAEEGEVYPPLVQPESLILDMSEREVRNLNQIDATNDAFVSYAGRADDLIRMMGTSEYPDLVQQYTDFFDGQWGGGLRPSNGILDIRGLGSDPFASADGRGSHQEIGFFYGFVDEGSGFLVLQIRPGSNLNPTDNPEDFISTRLSGLNAIGGINFAYFGLRDINEYGRMIEQYVARQGRTDTSIEFWSLSELINIFEIQRGTIITTIAGGLSDDPGTYRSSFFFLQVNEMPEEDQISGYRLLNSYGDY